MRNINIVCETDHSEKLDVEWNFNLECDKPWVSLPNTFCLSGQQTSFKLKVDFSKFQPNSVQVAIVRCLETLRISKCEILGFEVKAVDTLHPEAGFLWFLPITIIVPMSIGDSGNFALNVSNLNLKPASIHRYFIHAPCGAEWASKTSSFFWRIFLILFINNIYF